MAQRSDNLIQASNLKNKHGVKMKKVILMMAIVMAAVIAEAGTQEKYNYTCDEIDATGDTFLTVNLYDESEEGLQDGTRAEFSIQVLENDGISDASEIYSGTAIAKQEDVIVTMKNKKVTVRLYLDEDDQAWIQIHGKNSTKHRLRCELL